MPAPRTSWWWLDGLCHERDEQAAREAGCDGYITKPIDTRTLPGRVRTTWDSSSEASAPRRRARTIQLCRSRSESLRQRFLAEGEPVAPVAGHSRVGLRRRAGAQADAPVGGAAGLSATARFPPWARGDRALLAERPLDNAQLRDALTRLIYAFTSPPETARRRFPGHRPNDQRRRFALSGFPMPKPSACAPP
jgi:CheY-like chemotaxis protein